MSKYLTVVMLLGVLLLSMMAQAGESLKARSLQAIQGKRVPAAQEPLVPAAGMQIPMQETLPFVRLAGDPATGDTFLLTNYDLGWNSPTNKIVVSYDVSGNPGTRAHLSAMRRTAPPPSAGPRSQYYVYYNGTSYVGAPAFAQSVVPGNGFGSLDVFRGGPGDGFAAVTTHQPAHFGINTSPGDTSFTPVSILVQPPNHLDPKPAIDQTNQVVYVITSGRNRNGDAWLFKSTDYGTSWSLVDSLAARVPTDAGIEDLDHQMQVTANGDIYVFLTGSGSLFGLPPVGTGDTTSSNKLGYLKSTNGGASWVWQTVFVEGQRPITSQPNDYYVPLSNGFVFGNGLAKWDACVDGNGVVHFVMNGQAIDITDTNNVHMVFGILYWNSATGTWRQISREADRRNPANDSLLADPGNSLRQYANNAAGQPAGRSHPTIAYMQGGNSIFVSWTEPDIVGSTETVLNDKWVGQVWYNYSNNGGATWSGATQLTSSTNAGKYWVSADRRLTTAGANPNVARAHLAYLQDQDNRSVIGTDAGANPNLMKPWIYRWIDFAITGVDDRTGLPQDYNLSQNFPNPFNPATKITFSLPKEGFVTLKVYNTLGQEVKTLVNEIHRAGNHEVDFDAPNLPSGVYFYKLSAGSFLSTKKMVLLK